MINGREVLEVDIGDERNRMRLIKDQKLDKKKGSKKDSNCLIA